MKLWIGNVVTSSMEQDRLICCLFNAGEL